MKQNRQVKIGTKKLDLSEKDINRYSITRAIGTLYDPQGVKAGYERDLSDQICKRDNRETRGVVIPQEILDHNTFSYMPKPRHILTDQVVHGLPPTNNRRDAMVKRGMLAGVKPSGGYLVDEELRSLIEILVENTLALQNIPAFNVEGSPVNIPGQTTRVTPRFTRESPFHFESIEFSNATTQAAVTALTSPSFALITISGNKYVAFKSPSTETVEYLNQLRVGDQLTADTHNWEIAAEYDASNNRIQVNSSAVTTGMNNGDNYRLFSTNEIQESTLTFSNIAFKQRFLKARVHVSRTAILLASTDMEMFIRMDITNGISKAMDSGLFFGRGDAQNEPLGVNNTTGINKITYNESQLYSQIVRARRLIEERNISTANLKWLASWYFPTPCKTNKKYGTHSRTPIMDRDGMIDGVPVEVSSQIKGTSGELVEGFLGNWMESAITIWQDLELEVDPYTLLHQGINRVVAVCMMDFNILRSKAFCRLGG